MFVPPKLDSSLFVKYLEKAISANQYSNFGPLVEEFTERLASYFEVAAENVVLVSNATLAIEAAIATSPATMHDERGNCSWLLPSWTFAATGLAAQRAQVLFKFADVDPQFGILENHVGESRVNILSVAPFGAGISGPQHQDSNLIDAAASFDALMGVGRNLSRRAGVIVSLHATKSLSSGEGGVFLSLDEDWVARVKSYISFGFSLGERESRSAGTNGKMSEITAAAGLASLDNWLETRQRWLKVHNWANQISDKHSLFTTGAMREDFVSPYWIIRLKNQAIRNALATHLDQFGIASRLWWNQGLHRMPAFIDTPRGDLINTEGWAETYLGLPFYPDLSPAELELIDKALEGFNFT